MNIIIQNIEIGIKNILKGIFNTIFSNHSNDLVDALMNNFSSLKLQEYKVSRIKIMDLYLSTYDKVSENRFEYNKNKVSYSIFENKTSIISSKSSSNPVSIVLNNMVHGFRI